MSDKKIKPTRPFSLEYAEAKSKIINAINEATQIHGVPFYLLEDIIVDVSYQVRERAAVERENAKSEYEKKLAEYERSDTEC